MMKFSGNLESPVIEPESGKNRERGKGSEVERNRWEERARRVRANKRLQKGEQSKERGRWGELMASSHSKLRHESAASAYLS